MAATMTQIECNTNGAPSPPPLLKLGLPQRSLKSPPEEALQQLCDNVERLNAYFASSTTTTDPNSFCSTPIGSETPAEEEERLGLAVKSVGIHCGNTEDQDHHTERTKEEFFQMAILSRKFLSKKIPPISLQDYLLRLHRYCPMSTAVFLATSVYITRMTLVEKMFRVTPKNMHRLVLAGLLVAIKALEDLGFPHTRIAKVGGVGDVELSKLEMSFCFLADFDLRVDARMLMNEMNEMNHMNLEEGLAPESPGPE
ncbi:hypothetical protein N7481_003529 [Penicillium waksmanii]|uniref:uncharacterized protein n=1 Tax=Penicillium waksmanii TaxID=69791 RepID=UPI00254687BE|nr:uncharacterized protein N7481_003529 [Penicillium waksmanii]KAJ5988319.1 hypothetical protein N7481_003529 [Penicillium waksmanii]